MKKVRNDLRSITGDLQIPKFGTGFTDEIRFFAENFQEKHPELIITIDAQEPLFPLTMAAKQNIFRIYRSSLANVAKHADARHIHISLVTNEDMFSLVIQDDGIGFSSATSSNGNSAKHYGILLNEHYADLIGAKLEISSSQGNGTTVTLNFQKPKRGIKKLLKRRITE